MAYIYDATIKGRIPALARPLLERTLGFDSPERFDDCDGLIAALDEAMRKTESLEAPTSLQETPAPGQRVCSAATRRRKARNGHPSRRRPKTFPFERLGHFRILEQIGGGGMGDVYRGYDESLDRPWPSKVLRRSNWPATRITSAASTPRPPRRPAWTTPTSCRSTSSARTAGTISSPCSTSRASRSGERLSRAGVLPVDEALAIVAQCLAGLQAAHAQG